MEIDERLIPIFKRSFLHINFFTSENYPKEFKPDITFGIGSLAGFLRQSVDSFKNQKIKFLEKEIRERLYSTCASPVVPHPSTGHAHGCLASEIGRDPVLYRVYGRS